MPKTYAINEAIILSTFCFSTVYLFGVTHVFYCRHLYTMPYTSRQRWIKTINETILGLSFGAYVGLTAKAIADLFNSAP
jgi:hypothetical protein